MLFDEPVLFFRGLTIYRDFSNPNTFYFLPPEAPRIARSAENSNDYAMRLVLYRPDPNAPPPQGMENGGGFLNLDVDLHVSASVLEEVEEEVRERFGGRVNLVPVPFTSGSVELILLGVGKEDEGQPFVRKVAGSTTPSLYGTQRAAFSVVLDRDGAALMEQVIEEGGATMALALYHLTYAGIGPAYNLKITIDYKRVFEQLDLSLKAGVNVQSGGSSFVGKAGFHMLMEQLRETRAVLVEEVDPIPGENGRTPTDQTRIDQIIANLMGSTWFKPSLAQASQMTNVAGAAGAGATEGGDSDSSGSGGQSSGSRKAATWEKDSQTPAQFPADRGIGPFSASSRGTKETLNIRGEGATAKVGATAAALEAKPITDGKLEVDVPADSQRHVEIKWPATPAGTGGAGERQPATSTRSGPETQERGLEPFAAAPSGDQEKVTIRGDGATAKVGDSATSLQPKPLDGQDLKIDVAAGETKHFEITWPGGVPSEDTFHLFFDYDRPHDPSDDPNDVNGYAARTPSPAEGTASGGEQQRFLPESRAASRDADPSPRGPAALDSWLDSLEPGITLQLDSHASFEGDDTKLAFNQALSERRNTVAERLINSRFPTTSTNHGHVESKLGTVATLPLDTAPENSRHGKPQHRVVLIKGMRRGGDGQVVTGTITRPESTGPSTSGKPECTLKGHFKRDASGGGDGDGDTTVQASFEINLEMIEREEHLTATYELNTRKARTQEVHPQGQLILDAINPGDYILEADGAIDFFQWLDIEASTTAQWEAEGINSIHIQLRYAPRGNGAYRRTGEIVLSSADERGNWKVGVLHEDDDDRSTPVLYRYDYRVTVHYLPDVALGDQSGAATSAGIEGADAEGWITTTERNLVIHPREVTPAVTVNVTSGIMRFDLLQRVQIVLSYGPYRQNLTLSAETPEHQLVIRPEPGLEDEALVTEGTLFYKDGAQVQLPRTEWQRQELIFINEPRENVLRVQALLADPANVYEKVLIRLRYENGNRIVEEPFEFTEHAEMKEWAVRLEDPEQRAWQYQATLIKRSGDIDTIDWTPGEENQLILGVRAADVIPVQVTLLIPPVGDLLAVKVDLRYEDGQNGVDWKHSELIRGEHTGVFSWSIAIVNPRLQTYQYKVTEFHRSGQKEGAWQDSSETQLVLLPLE